MKIRNDYVSNSSSSSFLINLEKDASEYTEEDFIKLFKAEPSEWFDGLDYNYYLNDILEDLKYSDHFEIPHYPYLYFLNYHDNSDPEKYSIMYAESEVNKDFVLSRKNN